MNFARLIAEASHEGYETITISSQGVGSCISWIEKDGENQAIECTTSLADIADDAREQCNNLQDVGWAVAIDVNCIRLSREVVAGRASTIHYWQDQLHAVD